VVTCTQTQHVAYTYPIFIFTLQRRARLFPTLPKVSSLVADNAAAVGESAARAVIAEARAAVDSSTLGLDTPTTPNKGALAGKHINPAQAVRCFSCDQPSFQQYRADQSEKVVHTGQLIPHVSNKLVSSTSPLKPRSGGSQGGGRMLNRSGMPPASGKRGGVKRQGRLFPLQAGPTGRAVYVRFPACVTIENVNACMQNNARRGIISRMKQRENSRGTITHH
jgi:hypothetical protein